MYDFFPLAFGATQSLTQLATAHSSYNKHGCLPLTSDIFSVIILDEPWPPENKDLGYCEF